MANAYQIQKDKFDNLNEKQQWKWIMRYKDKVTLTLDSDNTTFTFDAEGKTDDCTLFSFKADIGNSWGLDFLLKEIGVKHEHA